MSRSKLNQAKKLLGQGNIAAARRILESMPDNLEAQQILSEMSSPPSEQTPQPSDITPIAPDGKEPQAERLAARGNFTAAYQILAKKHGDETARGMILGMGASGDQLRTIGKTQPRRRLPKIVVAVIVAVFGLCAVAIAITPDPEEETEATSRPTFTSRPTRQPTEETRLEPAQMTATASTENDSESTSPSNSAASDNNGETVYITGGAATINVRSCAGTDCRRVDGIAFGTEVTIIDEDTANDGNLWYQIEYDGGTAWVHSDLTSETRPIAQPAQPSSGGGGTESESTQPPAAQPQQSEPTQVPAGQLQPTQAPPTQPPTSPPVAAGCSCAGNTLNCGNFSTHNEAQACHDKCKAERGFDVHRLDRNDNDGLACESLPYGQISSTSHKT